MPCSSVRMRAVAFAGTSILAACGTGAAGTSAALAPASTASIDAVLQQSWAGYRRAFITDGRVSDPGRGGDTTSEGQSYALLRAVWIDDRSTFDSVWRWTQANLQVRGDHVFAWHFGHRGDGSTGVIDAHSATDADSDIALALLLAARRWGDAGYAEAGRAVAADIWNVDTVQVSGQRVVTAGDWAAQRQDGTVVNPSYFAPYAYRIFAAADAEHPWLSVVDSSYALLDRCTAATLNGRHGELPPNWCTVSAVDGVGAWDGAGQADDYGFDAFRVMWRTALDYQWNHEGRARDYLQRNGRLRDEWGGRGRLAAVYAHDGSVVSDQENPAVYGGDVGNLVVTDPGAAHDVLDRTLLAAYDGGGAAPHFGDPSDYYAQNWAWFGIALAGGRLDQQGG